MVLAIKLSYMFPIKGWIIKNKMLIVEEGS